MQFLICVGFCCVFVQCVELVVYFVLVFLFSVQYCVDGCSFGLVMLVVEGVCGWVQCVGIEFWYGVVYECLSDDEVVEGFEMMIFGGMWVQVV